MGADAAAEGAASLAPWAAKTRSIKQVNPNASTDLEGLIRVIERVKPEFYSRDFVAAVNDSNYLAKNGYC